MNNQYILLLLGVSFIILFSTCKKKESLDESYCDCAETPFIVNIENNQIMIPNIITPNGDGRNDLWIVEIKQIDSLSPLVNIEVEITKETTKNLIYQSSQYHREWNGELNGVTLPNGKYLYKITILDTIIEGYVCIFTTDHYPPEYYECLEQCIHFDENDPLIDYYH